MADTEQEAYTLEEGLSRENEPRDGPKVESKVPDKDQIPPPVTPAQGEPRESSLPLSENSMKVLKRRYLERDTEGNVIETAEEMFQRVAQNIAQADLKYDPDADVLALEQEFYDFMTSLEFLPNSPL